MYAPTATGAGPDWAATEGRLRASVLERAADACEAAADELFQLDAEGAEGVTRAVEYLDFFAAQARSEFAGPERLPGPTGEQNELSLHPRGVFACLCHGGPGVAALAAQIGAALAAGNTVVAWHPDGDLAARVATVFKQAGLPGGALAIVPPGKDASLAEMIVDPRLAGVAFAGPLAMAAVINRTLAMGDGPIRSLVLFAETPDQGAGLGNPLSSGPRYLHRFAHERTLSIDTTASGGNASLLSLEEEQG
jgi:RHH-type proline utilization regulon transcriptional repressor/proline dehydrogenase/delta 1-pyrroline-5-carboxylate dehydrogenase